MAHDPIRRSQLIAPHGIGSMMVIKGGVSVMTCGLDHWYERESLDNSGIDIDEFKVEEYRLQRILNVDHFRLPPDFRAPMTGVSVPNNNLNIPFVRFPRWHVCSRCNRMEELRLTDREVIIKCRECQSKGKKGMMQQAVFVAMCEKGHLQDFPWREWVHRTIQSTCERSLRYVTSGGASLAAQRVKCDCGDERPLSGITNAEPDGSTTLSKTLSRDEEPFLCKGLKPWLGATEGVPCENHLRGTLRGATNVWFAKTYNAIYLPQSSELAPAELVTLLRSPNISGFINILVSLGQANPVDQLKNQYRFQLDTYSKEQIEAALKIIRGEEVEDDSTNLLTGEDSETAFRRAEFSILRTNRREDLLVTNACDLNLYEPEIAKYFSRIVLISKLRETRVFGGFSRIYSEREISVEERKEMLWNEVPEGSNAWLPASVVYGEGIFLELNENLLRDWEEKNQNVLRAHLKNLIENFERVRTVRGLKPKKLIPRFILLHTLAHILINRLTFDCGYSSASLRERIYVSDHPEFPMAGLLIYTADGDSEGTMGGLVRMGNPGFFEPVLRRSIEAAEWCSADPVCREMGAKNGQGPDSCNLAACHSCALLPETSCDEFNRFLDRSVITNGLGEEGFAFFKA
jgi:hypothetical protein